LAADLIEFGSLHMLFAVGFRLQQVPFRDEPRSESFEQDRDHQLAAQGLEGLPFQWHRAGSS